MLKMLSRINDLMNPTIEEMQQHLQARPRHIKLGPYVERYLNKGRHE